MQFLKEHRDEPNQLADLLPWALLTRPGVIRTKTGAFMACLRYRGPDLESSGKSEQLVQASRLNQALKRLPAGWVVHNELSREAISSYPPRQPDVPWIVGQIDDECGTAFALGDTYYASTTTWTLTYQPPKGGQQRLLRWLWEGLPDEEPTDAHHLEYFTEKIEGWERQLRDLCPEVERLEDEKLLSYLHYTVSTDTQAVAMPETPMYLDALLASRDLTPGVRPQLDETYVRCLTVRLLPPETSPGLFAQLDMLPFPFRWVQRWIPMEQSAAVRECKKYARIWKGQEQSIWTMIKQECLKMPSSQHNELAMQYAAEASGTQALVASGDIALGYYTGTIVVWHDNAQMANERLMDIAHLFRACGATVHVEDLNTVDAWLGTLPGNVHANVRRPLVHSMNLAHLLPFHTLWNGPAHNAHLNGPPLLLATTHERTPFRLSLHQGDVGDTLVIGPKGSGKSLFLGTVMLQWLARYDKARVFAFEMGQSLRIATQTAGGTWYALGDEHGLALQPLAQIDQLDERVWASEWLEILYKNEEVTLNPTQKREVWNALTTLASHEPPYRTLSSLCAILQDIDLRQGLQPYTLSGNYGGILDADTDCFPTGRLQTFEMESLRGRPKIIGPAILALLHRIDQELHGDPTIILLDEGWLYLDIPVFKDDLRAKFKTLRKKNASIIFASQNLADVSESSLASTIAQECSTMILLPNAGAFKPEVRRVYEAFGLSERQIELLALSTPKRDYYYTSPSGARLFQLELGSTAMASVGRTSMADLAQFQAVLDSLPDDLAQAWLKHLQQ